MAPPRREPEYAIWEYSKFRRPDRDDASTRPIWHDDYQLFLREVGKKPVGPYTVKLIDKSLGHISGNYQWVRKTSKPRSVEYRVWESIRNRGSLENALGTPIWIHNFRKFVEELGNRPDKYHVVGLRDDQLGHISGNYCWMSKTYKHGHSKTGLKTPEYRAWGSIITKCYNRDYHTYSEFGGSGILMHPAWKRSFKLFLAEVGYRPSPRHVLDRIDKKKGFIPGNCKWFTRRESYLRRKNGTRIIELDGVSMTATEWSIISGVPPGVITKRIDESGWEIKKAIFEVPHHRNLEYAGRTQSLNIWAKEFGLSRSTLFSRLALGWDIGTALTTPAGKRTNSKDS